MQHLIFACDIFAHKQITRENKIYVIPIYIEDIDFPVYVGNPMVLRYRQSSLILYLFISL